MESKGMKVYNMAISINEDWLVCSMENNQLIAFPFQNLDMVKPNEVPKDMIVQVSLFTYFKLQILKIYNILVKCFIT